MPISHSTASALIVLLAGIFIFKSLENIPTAMKLISYPYYTIIGAILMIVYRNKILDVLKIK